MKTNEERIRELKEKNGFLTLKELEEWDTREECQKEFKEKIEKLKERFKIVFKEGGYTSRVINVKEIDEIFGEQHDNK